MISLSLSVSSPLLPSFRFLTLLCFSIYLPLCLVILHSLGESSFSWISVFLLFFSLVYALFSGYPFLPYLLPSLDFFLFSLLNVGCVILPI